MFIHSTATKAIESFRPYQHHSHADYYQLLTISKKIKQQEATATTNYYIKIEIYSTVQHKN